jgi:threonine/homoserine/homoserine lactone efflux protein
MSLDLWLSFVVIVLIAVFSPGPAVLLAVTHGSQSGARRAVWPILGNITGLAILISLSSLGIGTVLAASSDWLVWLRIGGGLYLVFLGIKLILSRNPALDVAAGRSPQKYSIWKTYSQGILVALSNPKALLLIGALFPQFVDLAQPLAPQLLILGATLMIMSFSALMIYAATAKKLIAKSSQKIVGKVNKITGSLFVGLGVALAAGSR